MGIYKKISAFLAGMLVQFNCFASSIPFAQTMADDAESDDLFEWLKGLVSNGFDLAFMLIGGIAFCVVMYNIIMMVIDWRKGRLELGELMNQAFVQIGVLVVVFVLLSFASAATD